MTTSEGTCAVDLEALPFMDMPSYSHDITLNKAVLAFTHSSFLINSPGAIDHIARCDYLALWKDPDALHFMSRRCVCSGVHFKFDAAPKHTAEHWCDLPDGASLDCASRFIANFLELPWFQNTSCYRAILHPVLFLRLLIELWRDGSLGHGDVDRLGLHAFAFSLF